jgi:hypothetical protein
MNNQIDVSKLRKPTSYEAERVCAFENKEIGREMKVHKSVNVIFTALGLFMTATVGASTGKGLVLHIMILAGAFIISFFAVLNKKLAMRELTAYANAEYMVCDGYISAISHNSEQLSYEVVSFTDNANTFTLSRMRALAKHGNRVGDRVILVCPVNTNIRKSLPKVYTSYMLSDDCLRK